MDLFPEGLNTNLKKYIFSGRMLSSLPIPDRLYLFSILIWKRPVEVHVNFFKDAFQALV